LHSSGVIYKWQYNGIRWVAFFQDTNGLAFTTLPAMLGVSLSLGLEVSVCVRMNCLYTKRLKAMI
jgi:UDP-sugar pyrophosphorylase